MNIKALQIILVLLVVLTAVGIALVLGRDRAQIDPDSFEAPAWLETLAGLAGGPSLEASELTLDAKPFQSPLRLNGNQSQQFAVASSGERVRRVRFRIVQGSQADVEIDYRPVSGQRVGDEQAEEQSWRNRDDERDTAGFVVYDRGGHFRFRNRSNQPVEVVMED